MILCIDCYRCEAHCLCTWPKLQEVKRSKCASCQTTARRKPCAPGKHEYAMAYNEGQNCINCGERAKLTSEYSIAEARALGLLDE